MTWIRSLLLLAVAAPGFAADPAFEVATIKPNASNDNRIMLNMAPGGRFIATGVTLRLLIQQAYDVRDFQISGGPAWMGTERWDVNAKADASALGPQGNILPDQLKPMLRKLLEERFQIKVKREIKEMAIYALVVAKGGSKLTESGENSKPLELFTGGPGAGPGGPGAAKGGAQGQVMRFGRGLIDARKMKIQGMLQQLSQMLGRAVVDKTGLTGEYDFTLKFTPEPGQGGPFGGLPPGAAAPPSDDAAPSIFTAIQEQLGLRLDSQRGPVDMLAIESADRPTDN